jgi:hypothetical protein
VDVSNASLLEMNAVVWAMEYYLEHLRQRRFILYTYYKPLESLGALHTKTINRLQLAMMDFDFKIRYKKDLKCQLISCQGVSLRLAQYRHSKLIEHTNKKMTFCII